MVGTMRRVNQEAVNEAGGLGREERGDNLAGVVKDGLPGEVQCSTARMAKNQS